MVKTGNLKSLRTWSDVRDAVRAYHMLLTVDPVAGAYYNIGGNFSARWKICWLFCCAIRLATTLPWKPRPRVSARSILQVPDTRKFENHTGWRPEIGFETTMTDLLDYWRQRIASGAVPLTR